MATCNHPGCQPPCIRPKVACPPAYRMQGIIDGRDNLAPVLGGDALLHRRLDVAVVALPRAVERDQRVWVDWFNNRRLLGPIGHVPPAEYEAAYYRGQQSQAMVA